MGMLSKLINALMIILSLTLGFFFVFVGIVKLTPAVKEDIHEEMQKQFVRMATVFPLADVLGFKVDPDLYRTVVGAMEVVCGIMLALFPGCLSSIANLLLVVTMAGAGYSHYALGDDLDKLMPAAVCGSLLTLRLITHKLLSSRDVCCPATPHTKSD